MHGLVQIVDKPTRDSNTLDLILVNNPTLVNNVEVRAGISDHDIVHAEINIMPQNRKQKKRQIPL